VLKCPAQHNVRDHMRLFTTVLTLLFSTSLLAIGPESIELFGVTESGTTVFLKYGGPDQNRVVLGFSYRLVRRDTRLEGHSWRKRS